MRSSTTASAISRFTSALILRTTSAGVPRGATSPIHESISKPAGPPASSTVGTSGALAMRFFAATAITLMRPALMSGSAEPMVENAQWISPLAMPMYICDWSLYGTWTIFVPVRYSNSAAPRCDGLPTYDEL